MSDQSQGSLVFHSRRGAIIALCVGILITLRNLRYLFELYMPGHTSWLTRYRFPSTPFDITLHLCTAVLFVGVFIFVLRRARGGERVYLSIFVGIVVLAPLSDIPSAASIHLFAWIAALMELGLIPSAITMYRTLPSHCLPVEATANN
jgi:hypothetical protein